jgi:membrane protease YdiL (CAAX protease family)
MESPPEPVARGYPWRTFAALVAAGTLTGPLVIPYARGLQAISSQPPALPSMPTIALIANVMVRDLALLLPAAGLGLLAARSIGLGAPYLEHWLDGGSKPARPVTSIVGPAIFWAVVTALVAFGADAFFQHVLGVNFPAPEIHARIHVVWWRSGLASFWAPFAEEILERLFLLSFVTWLGIKLFRVKGDGRGRSLAIAAGIVISSLFFGWSHIGNEQLFAATVPTIVVVRTMLIIVPVGIAFGWLYVRRGLEAVILSHFVIDVIVHVVRPLLEGQV